MFEKTKVNLAARRVNNSKRARRRNVRRPSFWARVWNIICWPFRQIARLIRWIWKKICQFVRWVWKKICQFLRWIWKKICEINLIGLLNLVLLIAIFVLCTMLILDIVNFRRKPVVIVADPVPVTTISNETTNPSVVAEPITKPVSANSGYIRPRTHTDTLPIARDTKTREMVAEPIRVANQKPNPVFEKQIAICDETMYGDIIIENRGDAKILNNGSKIQGNLYLQNMRKYVLPCGIQIVGNMFIRDVGMVQFCGDFEVTGNIYVSPRSSFGPIPTNARLGGQIIL